MIDFVQAILQPCFEERVNKKVISSLSGNNPMRNPYSTRESTTGAGTARWAGGWTPTRYSLATIRGLRTSAVAAGLQGKPLASYKKHRVTIHVVPNLMLTSKQKFCFSMRPMYEKATFVLVSTGGLTQHEWRPKPCQTPIRMAK